MRRNYRSIEVAALLVTATLTTVLFASSPPMGTPGGNNPDTGTTDGQVDRSQPTPAGKTGQADMGQNDRSETEMYKSFASDPKSIPDKLFVLEAWHGAQWEVAFSDLVIERVDDNDVKELAKMIRTDHQKASEKLRPIAKKLNVQLMDGLPPMKQAKLELLGKLSSDQLVKCYLANQRAMHAKDITSFGDHAVLAMNEEVKAFARDTLPTLREHGNHIIQIASTKGMTGDFVTAGGGSMNEPVNGQ